MSGGKNTILSTFLGFTGLVSLLFFSNISWAGGPAQVNASGTPLLQPNPTSIKYNLDPGPLQSSGPEGTFDSCGGGGGSGGCGSSSIMPWREAHAAATSNSEAAPLVQAAWNNWNNSGANVNVTAGAPLSEDVTVCNADKFIDAQTNFTQDGCDPRMCGNIVPKPSCCTASTNNPIIFDPTGDLIVLLANSENLRTQVLASTAQVPWPCNQKFCTDATGYAGFNIVINGVCLEDNADQHPSCKRADGTVIKWTAADLAVTMAHEFGHALGLTHTQVNPDSFLVLGPGNASLRPGADVTKAVPLMYPFALSNAQAPAVLKGDDKYWITHLYGPKVPSTTCTFTATAGAPLGIFSTPSVGSFSPFAGGPDAIRDVEVIFRPFNISGLDPIADAFSAISGYEGTANDGLLTSDHVDSQCTESNHINCSKFIISGVVPGDYCVDYKRINVNFTGGSRYGPLDPPFQSFDEKIGFTAGPPPACVSGFKFTCPPGGGSVAITLPNSKFDCDPSSSSCP